jgi:hypothetical protein
MIISKSLVNSLRGTLNHAPLFQTHKDSIADHNVIQDINTNNLASLNKTLGNLDIFGAWAAIPT